MHSYSAFRALRDLCGKRIRSISRSWSRYAHSVEVGLYAGSFDPVHLGHKALIAAASEMLDQLVVVVAANPQKRPAMFSVQERLEMLSGACRDFGNVRVAAHGGLLVDIAAQVGATVLVRSSGKETGMKNRWPTSTAAKGLRPSSSPQTPRPLSSRHTTYAR